MSFFNILVNVAIQAAMAYATGGASLAAAPMMQQLFTQLGTQIAQQLIQELASSWQSYQNGDITEEQYQQQAATSFNNAIQQHNQQYPNNPITQVVTANQIPVSTPTTMQPAPTQ